MRVRMGLLVVPVLLLGLAACNTDDVEGQPAGQANSSQEAAAPASVKVAQSDLGPILVDQSGRALYGFTKDENQANACDTDDCIGSWPPLTNSSTVDAGEGLDAKLLKKDGDEQAVYGKWKLYYYVGDVVPGDLNGQALDDEWFLVAPDGSLVKKTA
ncbi:hypothetical protein LWC34_42520 [Kibdelosporangium philippinense]|uniref:Lipoprotein with Yx(FWY)xxD motif n=1 Tax=Kibdelosporangium philippinense TaxID=211113 RepID=A0ABS8ZR82_9PSEU|nr:hypothetical protein [Kibdelosporangium philippinense]MCE7009445.1 hypothetical protein [Kibdelosporangium philippinense]